MKKTLCAMMASASFFVFASVVFAEVREDIQLHKNCKVCGMDRKAFDYSRVLIEYHDGTTVGTCGTRCAAIDLALNIGKVPEKIGVGDFNTRQLIDAKKAYWVIGGRKEGTMSMRGKWAFSTRKAASAFIAGNGGRHTTFQKALRASFEDLYKDLRIFWESMKKKPQEETE